MIVFVVVFSQVKTSAYLPQLFRRMLQSVSAVKLSKFLIDYEPSLGFPPESVFNDLCLFGNTIS